MNKLQSSQALVFLYQAARAISTKLSTDEVLQQLMVLTHQHFQPDAVSVALVESDGYIVFRAASGKSARDILGLRMEPGSGIVGWVAQHGETLWVPNVYQDARFYPQADQQTGFRTQAILAAPVKLGEQTLAVVEMLNPAPDTDLEAARKVLNALASLAAHPIQNAQLFEQVQHAQARYESLFEQNFDPIMIVDDNAEFLQMNYAAQKLFDLLALSPEAFTPDVFGITLDEFETLKHKARAGKITMREFHVQVENQPAKTFELYLSHLPDYPPTGAYQWIAHDITDRVALEDMRQQLANMIVHDLRVPLGSVINSMELSLTAWQDRDTTLPVEQILKIGLRSAHQMEILISNILDAARLQVGEKTLNLSTITISDLVTDVLEIVQSPANRKKHTLTTQLAPNLPPIQADADLLQRVLINILSNAIKYTPDNGVIMLTVTADTHETHFTVRDNGPGIAPEEQPYIFDMFYRGQAAQSKGAGLGLAFCKLAVEAHEGRIWLESTVGEGTAFHFALPHRLSGELEE